MTSFLQHEVAVVIDSGVTLFVSLGFHWCSCVWQRAALCSLVWQCPALCSPGRSGPFEGRECFWPLSETQQTLQVSGRVTRHSRRADGLRNFAPSDEIVISAANERGLKRRRPENRASQLGFMEQRVVNVVTDTWLATAGLRGGQILEASFSTFAASHAPLPSGSAVSQGFCTSRWTGQLRRKSLLCRAWRPGEVSFYLLQLSLKSFFLHSRAGVRLLNQRLQTLRRPCHWSLRHQSFRMVGT